MQHKRRDILWLRRQFQVAAQRFHCLLLHPKRGGQGASTLNRIQKKMESCLVTASQGTQGDEWEMDYSSFSQASHAYSSRRLPSHFANIQIGCGSSFRFWPMSVTCKVIWSYHGAAPLLQGGWKDSKGMRLEMSGRAWGSSLP